MRNPEDVKQEDYTMLYRPLLKDCEDYLHMKHFSLEGKRQFRAILFIPHRAPNMDCYDIPLNGNIE